MNIKLSSSTKRVLIVIGIVVGVILGFKYILPLTIPFLFAYIIAYILNPFVKFMNVKFKINRGLATIILLIVFGAIIGILVLVFGKILVEQLIKLIDYIPFYKERLFGYLDEICSKVDGCFCIRDGETFKRLRDGLENSFEMSGEGFNSFAKKSMSMASNMAAVLVTVVITITSTVLVSKDRQSISDYIEKTPFGKYVRGINQGVVSTICLYAKAQLIIMIVDIAIIWLALMINKNAYSLLWALTIGVLDALPAIGGSIIIIPWAIIQLFKGEFLKALVLLFVYILMTFVRQTIEPKIVGEKIGVPVVVTLISMYVGYRIFGIVGFVLGPIGFMVGKEIYHCIYNET